MKKKILEEIEKIRRKYSESAEEIVGGYNREQEISKDYDGRQIFELLQNADDEAEDDGKVLIVFDGKTLSVSNTGRPFTFEGVKSLLYPNASPKKKNAEKIGCKGLGFRSILTWANKVIVASKDFSIEFSQEYAKNFLKQIINEHPELEDGIKALSNDDFPIATLTCPKILDQNFLENDFATTIRIDCRDDKVENIKAQILNLEFEELVFLPTLKEIEIKAPNYHKKFFKVEGVDASPQHVLVESKDLISNQEDCVEWLVFKKPGEIKSKKYEFIIAYDPEHKRKGNVLYSYFKTDVKMSFPALIHGTFELTSDRNGLQKGSDINKELFPILCDFMVETAVRLSEIEQCCDYGPLKLVISSDMDDVLKNVYRLDSVLKEKINGKKILPSIQGKYISISDNPKYSDYAFDDVLNPQKFGSLLKSATDIEVKNYLKNDLRLKFYDYTEFAFSINNDLTFYSTEQKVNIISLIKQQFGVMGKPNIQLYLMEDKEGSNIVNDAIVYPLPGDDEVIDIPQWVEIKFLNRSQEDLFYKEKIAANKRDLVEKLAVYKVEEYSFEKLLRSVLNQFNSQITSHEKCVDILKWLWGYFNSPSHQQIKDVRVKVICRDGSIEYADKCYMGREFENSIGEKIVNTFSTNFVIDDLDFLNEEPLERKIDFYLWLGVALYPRFVMVSLPKEKWPSYLEYLYPIWNQHDKMVLNRSNFQPSCVEKIQVACFEHIENVFNNANFNDILIWMLHDPSWNECINSESEWVISSSIVGIPSGKEKPRTVSYSYIKSYLRYYLSNAEWILGNNGVKKKPRYCCFADNTLSPFVIVPEIDFVYIKESLKRECKKAVMAILNTLGIADNFYEMDKNVIYEILIHLPELDKNCKIGRSIYRNLLFRENVDEMISNNPKYEAFLKEGKVLVRCNGQKSYVPISSAFYADKKVSSTEILKQFNIFDLDAHKGVEKVPRIFGVQPLKNLNVELACTPDYHSLDGEFKKYYKEFLPYVYGCRLMSTASSKKDLGLLKKTEIHICHSIRLKYTYGDSQTESELKNFEREYIREKNVAYIKVNDSFISFDGLIHNQEFDEAVAEIIAAIIDVNEEKDAYQLLFKENHTYREKWMRSSRGDEDLEILTKARKEFNLERNARDAFWRDALEANGHCDAEDLSSDEIIKRFCAESIDESNINYEKINESPEFLIDIFDRMEIDVEDFNQVSSVNIDISEYWSKQLIEKIEKYKSAYLVFEYEQLKSDEDCVEKYEELKRTYGVYEQDSLNSIHFNINLFYKKMYGVSFEELDKIEDPNIIAKVIERNRKKNVDKISNLTKKCTSELLDIYLLFDRLDLLEVKIDYTEEEEKELQEEIKNQKEKTSELLSEIRNSGSAIFDDVHIAPLSTMPKEGRGKSGKKKKGAHSALSDQVKQNDGLIGEAKVYYGLKKKYSDSVEWVSRNAQIAGVVAKGYDTYGYDIKYTDEEGNIHYVEVKASRTGDIAFSLTKNEIDHALLNARNYEIIFVFLDDKGKPIGNPKLLGNIFSFEEGENLLNNKRFSIENKDFSIYAKIVDDETKKS